MRCYYQGISSTRSQVWESAEKTWSCPGISMECNIVHFCRKAFGDKYKNMWIDPIYFDDKYTSKSDWVFSEVGVALYPKSPNIKPRDAFPNEDKAAYRLYLYELSHEDIERNIKLGATPIYVVVKGESFLNENKELQNRILSVERVPQISGKSVCQMALGR